MTREQRIAIWVVTLIGMLVAWKLFGQGFGGFRSDQPFLARNYSSAVDPCSPGTVTNVAGLTVWLKADALVYNDSGSTLASNTDLVYTWKDSSTNGNDVVQATSGSRPYYNTNGPNGKPMIEFTNKVMDRVYSAALVHPVTYFVVYQVVTGSADAGYIFNGTTDSDEFLLNSDSMQMGNYGFFVRTLRASGFAKDTWYYDTLFFITTSQSTAWTNGVSTGAGSGPGLGDASSLRLGKNNYGTGGATFKIAELIIYNANVSSNDCVNINCYLKTKYGL